MHPGGDLDIEPGPLSSCRRRPAGVAEGSSALDRSEMRFRFRYQSETKNTEIARARAKGSAVGNSVRKKPTSQISSFVVIQRTSSLKIK